ncbi:MAG: TolC family protein [Flavobacterium sp.]|uniref:TolC family protein n=1 Tax=Flavobacterium sp. TaxID=239 RepID=UPI001209438E|nr:TolC family protein [Flavobacterium sp.]RZJ67650.1 MAG: TolC family protein [Flavobacterium sp.]
MKAILQLIAILSFGFAVAQTNETPKKWSLADCIAYAIKNNITIKDAVLTQQSAEVNLTQSKYAKLPSLSGSVSQNATNGTSIDPITSNYVSQMIHSTNVGVGTQLTLFNGNYLNNTVKENELLVKQNEFFVSEAKNNISLSVTEAYLQALYYKEAIAIAENTVASSKEQVSQMKVKYDAGSVAQLDVADLQTQQSSDEVNLITSKNNYRQQLITLKQLLELDPLSEFDIESPELPDAQLITPDLKSVYETAVSTLPEIKSAKTQIEISQVALDKSKAGYLPTLSLNAGLYSGYTSTQDPNLWTQMDGNFYQTAGLQLSIPIFSNYKNKASVANAKIDIEKSKIAAVSESKQLYLKIESAWQNATSAQSQLDAATALRSSSKLAYEMAQKKATAGALSSPDLIVSKNTYLSAEQQYLQAKFSMALYYQLLQFYQGNEITI